MSGRSETRFAVIISLISLYIMSVQTAPHADELELVDYFAGKDELCLESELHDSVVTLKRLILVIDIYGVNDREVYCTLVTVSPARHGHEKRKFSASNKKCRELMVRQPVGEFRIRIAKDHVCELDIPPKKEQSTKQ